MVRLQLLSRKMNQAILVDESCQGFFDRVPPVSSPKHLSPPELIPDYHLNSVPPGLAGAGMSSAHSNSSNQQHYCLRWNNHQHNFLGVLESVLSSQQHADVSLFCEGHVLRVHKLVLLASSSHFERILDASPAGQQPVIILDGTKFADLRALVDYMYRGEVNIEQEQLSSLLKTAETLKIKGLADVANKEDDRGGGGSGGSEGGGASGGLEASSTREGANSLMASPPSKRSKASPVDSCASNREVRDLRDTRDLIPVEPRDLSREGPRDLSSHFTLANSNGGHPLVSRRTASPTHSLPTPSSLASARSLLYSSTLISRGSPKSPVPTLPTTPYFSGALVRPRSPHHQFDPAPGSSLHPPRTSPQSPAPDHKSAPQISIPPFGLPFTLPILHESKKMLDRSSHKLLPSHYDSLREEREKDYLPPSWPPRGADLDMDREREHEREWERDREKNNDIFNERLQLARQQHQQQQQQQHQQQQQQQHSQPQPQPQHQQQHRPQLQHQQEQLSSHHHQQQRPPKSVPPPQPSPLAHSQPLTPKLANISKMELLDKGEMEQDKRHEEDKFGSSPEKDTSFSPPDDSVSSKTDYTPEGDPVEDDEDSSTGGSIRDGMLPTGNGDVPNLVMTGTNGRPPPGTTSTTPATTPTEMVKCPYCPRSYRHQNNLRTHIRCFHKGVRIPCPICHRGFTRWFTVRCHIAREHQNVDFSRPENLPAQLRRALYPPFAE